MTRDGQSDVPSTGRRGFLDGVGKTAIAGGIVTGTTALSGVGSASPVAQQQFDGIEGLDEQSLFHFTFFSDHWGHYPDPEGPQGFQQLAWLENKIQDSGSEFVLTAGDHLTAPRDDWFDQFNAYITDESRSPDFWREEFYPVIGNHDTQYYGGDTPEGGEEIWGAGAPWLQDANLHNRSNVTFAPDKYDWYKEAVEEIDPPTGSWYDPAFETTNPKRDATRVEYYAEIEREDVTVHFIGAYHDAKSEFRELSRRFLVETLRDIDKGKRDIVIAAGHSWSGNFIDHLNKKRTWTVLEKADFVFSGDTHEANYYMGTSDTYLEYNDEPNLDYTKHPEFPEVALVLNSGAINEGPDPGYFEMHVFEDPLRVVAQYVSNKTPERKLLRDPPAPYGMPPFVKELNGPITPMFTSIGGLEPTSLWGDDVQPTEDGGQNQIGGTDEEESEDDSGSDSVPGFGTLATGAGVLGGAEVARRLRASGDSDEQE